MAADYANFTEAGRLRCFLPVIREIRVIRGQPCLRWAKQRDLKDNEDFDLSILAYCVDKMLCRNDRLLMSRKRGVPGGSCDGTRNSESNA